MLWMRTLNPRGDDCVCNRSLKCTCCNRWHHVITDIKCVIFFFYLAESNEVFENAVRHIHAEIRLPWNCKSVELSCTCLMWVRSFCDENESRCLCVSKACVCVHVLEENVSTDFFFLFALTETNSSDLPLFPVSRLSEERYFFNAKYNFILKS